MKECDAVTTLLDSAFLVNRARQRSSRIPLQARVLLTVDQEVVEGELVNISLHGAMVVPARPIEVGTCLRFSVRAPASGRSLTDLNAKVVRVASDGIGLEFQGTVLL